MLHCVPKKRARVCERNCPLQASFCANAAVQALNTCVMTVPGCNLRGRPTLGFELSRVGSRSLEARGVLEHSSLESPEWTTQERTRDTSFPDLARQGSTWAGVNYVDLRPLLGCCWQSSSNMAGRGKMIRNLYIDDAASEDDDENEAAPEAAEEDAEDEAAGAVEDALEVIEAGGDADRSKGEGATEDAVSLQFLPQCTLVHPRLLYWMRH